ncbi:type II toxin-antitoxin system VapC family toxin [Streptomyces sp. NRRL S-337]|uniref:type II toxin-antitoxin system VapC family toxin n=1 Tax=Streptomyces sp. NRRL S-337 TaxID=1463900 RepID=UPI0004CC4F33|nr:PIN domain-containing protein [Streptomyces sp. NRRL S-337]
MSGTLTSGTLVLDCEGLSKLVRRSAELTEWLAAAEAEDIHVVTSSVTLVEARDPKANQTRFDYAVSRVNVVPPTEAIARHASKLLAAAGLHGHKYALDAIVAATALASPAPVTVLTSDPEDLRMLCGSGARVVKV